MSAAVDQRGTKGSVNFCSIDNFFPHLDISFASIVIAVAASSFVALTNGMINRNPTRSVCRWCFPRVVDETYGAWYNEKCADIEQPVVIRFLPGVQLPQCTSLGKFAWASVESTVANMDFRSMNKFNVAINTLSGNFLPLDETDTDLGFIRKSYSMFTWLVKFAYLSATTVGLLSYTSTAEAIQKGGVNTIVTLETLVLTIYLKSRRRSLCNLIRKINSVIVDSNDLKLCIRDTIESPKKRLEIYSIAAAGSVVIWAGMPVMKLLETDRFTYNDFTVTAYLPGLSAPFTVTVFLCGVCLEILGNVYIIVKKTGIDVYICYLITLVTAEYRYLIQRITVSLTRNNNNVEQLSVAENLQKCIRHQCIVMEISKNLRNLLSLNVGLTYLNCILRFCFLAFAVITIPSGGYVEKLLCLIYTCGNLIHVYMLCSCIQDLLDASTSITDDAFHEDWYDRSKAVKSIFRTIVLSNRMECRLTAFRIIDLTIPTFASIMNQAYTGCLLLLRMN